MISINRQEDYIDIEPLPWSSYSSTGDDVPEEWSDTPITDAFFMRGHLKAFDDTGD